MTSTDTASFVVEGGTPTVPRPLRLNASSVVFPNKILPIGEAGAVVFDTTSKTLKYHDGISWIELLSQADILAPVNISLTDIYNQLDERVSTVTYSSNTIASASISGTNLNIIFPSDSGGVDPAIPGLFTSSPPGSIMQYALMSGQSVASIREQLSGVTGGQTGRNGTQANPYVTKTGWCFADGLWWTWNGTTPVTKIVPNLNQEAYLKSITTSGVTKIDAVITGSGSINSTSIDMPLHYHGTGMMLGLSGSEGDDGIFISGKTWNDGISYQGVQISGNIQSRRTSSVNGSDSRTALSTTYPIYPNGNTTTHTHTLSGIDVNHFNVAFLYNIAEPSLALNQSAGDARYVLKSGDVMSGSLTIANSATIQANDTNLLLWFRDGSGGERAAIYHNSTNNTLRLRAAGGPEVTVTSAGILTSVGLSVSGTSATVAGRNIVRSVNNTLADSNGNVTLVVGAVQDVRLGATLNERHGEGVFSVPDGNVMVGGGFASDSNQVLLSAPLQKLVSGIWQTVTKL
jgi:hypothetical protein